MLIRRCKDTNCRPIKKAARRTAFFFDVQKLMPVQLHQPGRRLHRNHSRCRYQDRSHRCHLPKLLQPGTHRYKCRKQYSHQLFCKPYYYDFKCLVFISTLQKYIFQSNCLIKRKDFLYFIRNLNNSLPLFPDFCCATYNEKPLIPEGYNLTGLYREAGM